MFYLDNEKPLGQRALRDWLAKACTQAELDVQSPHSLRHTFCSHLAMRGAPTRAIQELAGHSDLKTTQRYMHLTPAALESAIGLLEQPAPTVRLVALRAPIRYPPSTANSRSPFGLPSDTDHQR